MKYLLLICVICLALVSCGQKWNYSPLDSYIKASIKNSQDSTMAANEARQFINSINRK